MANFILSSNIVYDIYLTPNDHYTENLNKLTNPIYKHAQRQRASIYFERLVFDGNPSPFYTPRVKGGDLIRENGICTCTNRRDALSLFTIEGPASTGGFFSISLYSTQLGWMPLLMGFLCFCFSLDGFICTFAFMNSYTLLLLL